MKDAPISEFMTPTPHTVGAEQTITFAQNLMIEHGFRHLPVLHGGELVGVVSDRDLGLVAGLNDINPDDTRVEEAVVQVPYRVTADEPLSKVLQKMAEQKYGTVLVTRGEKVEGIFTTHDVVVLMAREVV